MVSLEWLDVQPAIGAKVSDYVLQHKKVDEYTDTDLYTGGCCSERVQGDASCALPGWELLHLWTMVHRAHSVIGVIERKGRYKDTAWQKEIICFFGGRRALSCSF